MSLDIATARLLRAVLLVAAPSQVAEGDASKSISVARAKKVVSSRPHSISVVS